MKTTNSTVICKILEFEAEGGYRNCNVIDSPTNCKLTYIEGFQCMFRNLIEKNADDFKYINEVLKQCRIAVAVNVNHKGLAELIKANFECYVYEEVPIGYSNGFQYHFIIRNPCSTNEYQRPLLESKKAEKVTAIDKKTVTNTLKTFLRAHKRKTDLIPEIIKIVENG